MKKIFTFLLMSLISFSVAYSQVTLTKESHGFISELNHQSIHVDYADPGQSGSNQVWDFSNLAVLEDAEDVLSEIDPVDSDGIINVNRNDDLIFHYVINDQSNSYLGYTGEKTKVSYTKPIVKTQYPQSFGTYFEGQFSGKVEYAGSKHVVPLKGTYSTHADASGTLILPKGIKLSVLRVHTIERIEYSNVTQVTDKYLWYAQEIRYPVLVTTETYMEQKNGNATCASTKSFMNANLFQNKYDSPTSLEAIVDDIAYTISPNPFQDIVEVSYSLPETTKVTVALYNSKGAKLTELVSGEMQSGHVSFTKNVATYTQTPDVYILKLSFGNKSYSEKLVKTSK
ncbi:T9SS type A sorting domain-containing protein [Bacteroidales bacterium OttesenSCG-928-M11]|nr:T9SS type A sorting domain-containing protein [Bacteroidales bacterium OttesenSCG-928-M11]